MIIRKKHLLTALFLFIAALPASGQKIHMTWKFSSKKLSDCEYDLVFTANMEPTWHLYSQIATEGDGPLPTVFDFVKNPAYKLVGKTIEPKPIAKPEPVWDNAVIRYFENTAVFHQKIKVLSDGPVVVKGSVDGMICNDGACEKFPLPFEFEFNLADAKKCNDEKTSSTDANNPCNCDTNAIITAYNAKNAPGDSLKRDTGKVKITETNAGNSPTSNSDKTGATEEPKDLSWVSIFLEGFLGGLAALFTPCVFPMIPMTVSFFTKRSKTKAKGVSNALTYAVSIIFIYVALGLGVTAAFGSDALNALSTNVWFNLFFFALLLVFAISFFGAFEIVLPSSFVNKVDSVSDKGGLVGIFFMAFTLSLVSFSCTGPIIGTLLVQATTEGGMGPFWGMFGFSLALALPFGFFAAFPGWLNSLPKSGGWLNAVKVFLGFLELAFAFKFLSNADLVVQT